MEIGGSAVTKSFNLVGQLCQKCDAAGTSQKNCRDAQIQLAIVDERVRRHCFVELFQFC